MERVKLIWEFRGIDSKKTAEHHLLHLQDFARIEQVRDPVFGVEVINNYSHQAFMVVDSEIMNDIRTRLKPHRGQRYKSS